MQSYGYEYTVLPIVTFEVHAQKWKISVPKKLQCSEDHQGVPGYIYLGAGMGRPTSDLTVNFSVWEEPVVEEPVVEGEGTTEEEGTDSTGEGNERRL